jgi:hypothetical protein
MADTTNRNDGHLDLSLKRTIDAPLFASPPGIPHDHALAGRAGFSL